MNKHLSHVTPIAVWMILSFSQSMRASAKDEALPTTYKKWHSVDAIGSVAELTTFGAGHSPDLHEITSCSVETLAMTQLLPTPKHVFGYSVHLGGERVFTVQSVDGIDAHTVPPLSDFREGFLYEAGFPTPFGRQMQMVRYKDGILSLRSNEFLEHPFSVAEIKYSIDMQISPDGQNVYGMSWKVQRRSRSVHGRWGAEESRGEASCKNFVRVVE